MGQQESLSAGCECCEVMDERAQVSGSKQENNRGDGHEHEHDHSHGGLSEQMRMILLLIASAVLYLVAVAMDGKFSSAIVVPIYVAVAVISGYPTFLRSLRNLFKMKFNTDTLMTIALIGAAAIGEWKEASLVAILFGLNEMLEGYGKQRTKRSMAALLKEAPQVATVIDGDLTREVPVSELRVGDITLVKSGEKIPSDGTLVGGSSSVNEAALTGESIPVVKMEGARVLGGSINLEGALQVRIDKEYENSSLARMWHLVQEAQSTKTPTQLFINRFARWYTPAILVIAALIMVVPPLFGGEWLLWLYEGLAVLIIGCPCALILSSPVAIAAGIARNARDGVLVKGGAFLEMLGEVDILAFDKTGTLTKGEPVVEQVAVFDEDRFYPVAHALEQSSSHPLARAILSHIESLLETDHWSNNGSSEHTETHINRPNGPHLLVEQFETISGQGVTAIIDGTRFWLGNEAIASHVNLSSEVKNTLEDWKQQGLTIVLVAYEQKVLGMFGIADEVRAESRAVVEALHRGGIRRTVMLTGDHPVIASKVALATGVSEQYGGLLPEDKVAKIKELQSRGAVAMIGDGMNDSPALATADLGIAMGKGTASAIETADIVLMQDHLGHLPGAVRLSRRINRIIRFNIAVALGLKAVALMLAIPGLLTMWIAILSDMGATIFVTLVSLSILINRRTNNKGRLYPSR